MNILFYIPLNTRSRDIESLAIYFSRMGHQVFLLTQHKYGVLHEQFKKYARHIAVDDSESGNTLIRVIKRSLKLIGYCYYHKINLVYAHLEPCNFIAVLCQYFIRARVVICRHHVDEARLYDFNRNLSYRLTYKLARKIIVVSEHAKRYMIQVEGIPEHRILHINLAYDFKLYALPHPEKVAQLRANLGSGLILLTVCRLTRYKRPELSIEVLKKLLKAGVPARLVILGRGELQTELQNKIKEEHLEEHCMLPGYVNNVLEYMAASDVLLHPSVLESSCISIKEAAIVNLPVVVCRGVGDFDEVIHHEVNGFLVDKNNFVEEASALVLRYITDPYKFKETAARLQETVCDLFDIEKIGPVYEKLFHHH